MFSYDQKMKFFFQLYAKLIGQQNCCFSKQSISTKDKTGLAETEQVGVFTNVLH